MGFFKDTFKDIFNFDMDDDLRAVENELGSDEEPYGWKRSRVRQKIRDWWGGDDTKEYRAKEYLDRRLDGRIGEPESNSIWGDIASGIAAGSSSLWDNDDSSSSLFGGSNLFAYSEEVKQGWKEFLDAVSTGSRNHDFPRLYQRYQHIIPEIMEYDRNERNGTLEDLIKRMEEHPGLDDPEEPPDTMGRILTAFRF